MKVRISFTVDIDSDAWAEEYSADRRDVRADVQETVKQFATSQLASLGMLIGGDS